MTTSRRTARRGRRAAGPGPRRTGGVRLERRDRTAEPAPVPGATPGGRLTIGIAVRPARHRDEDRRHLHRVRRRDRDVRGQGARRAPEGTSPGRSRPGAQREAMLTSGEVDLVFSTYTITDERKQTVDFAGPYFLAHQDLLVRRNETEITGPETLNGKDLCTVAGTTSAENILRFYQGRIKLKEFRAILRLRGGPGRQRGRRGDHRRRDPGRLRRRAAVPGQAQGHRRRASPTRPTASASRRATPRWWTR